MSGILAESEIIRNGHYTTRKPMFAAILATLGFSMRCVQPVEVIVNAGALVNFIDYERGNVNDLMAVQIHFQFFATHARYGKITCAQIECAYELAKAKQALKMGDTSDSQNAIVHRLTLGCHRKGVALGLFELVEFGCDMLSNWHILCQVIRQLNENPFLKFTVSLADNGVGHTLNPRECEDTAFRRSERLMRGENGRIHNPTR